MTVDDMYILRRCNLNSGLFIFHFTPIIEKCKHLFLEKYKAFEKYLTAFPYFCFENENNLCTLYCFIVSGCRRSGQRERYCFTTLPLASRSRKYFKQWIYDTGRYCSNAVQRVRCPRLYYTGTGTVLVI